MWLTGWGKPQGGLVLGIKQTYQLNYHYKGMCICVLACAWAEMGTHLDKPCIHILILAAFNGSGWLHVSQREAWS